MTAQDELRGSATLVLDGKDHSTVTYWINLRYDSDPNKGPGQIEGPFGSIYDANSASDVILRLEDGKEIEVIVTDNRQDCATIWMKNPPSP